MLELRTNCENCNTPLSANSEEAMICSFECTFCKDCVETILQNVCPNCGGGFEKRPIRPNGYLLKYPPTDKKVFKPIDPKEFQEILLKNKDINPADR